jgi:hypothetical protein
MKPITASSVLVIIAVVIFCAAALGAKVAGITLTDLGLAVGFLSFLV